MPRVKARLLPGGELQEVEASTVRELLEKIGGGPETHIVLRNGKPLLSRDRLRDGEVIDVIRVLSGG